MSNYNFAVERTKKAFLCETHFLDVLDTCNLILLLSYFLREDSTGNMKQIIIISEVIIYFFQLGFLYFFVISFYLSWRYGGIDKYIIFKWQESRKSLQKSPSSSSI